jgi:sugar phosphate isomerase/epimerase
LRLIKETNADNVYANLDTGNMIMYGYGNPVDALVTLRGYIRSFHIKDGTPPTDPYTLGKETYFGQGSVDFDRIFEWIGQTGFAGPLILELEIYNDQREQKLLETLATVREKVVIKDDSDHVPPDYRGNICS